MSMKENIKKKLSVLNPEFIEVVDESHKHIGHAGYGDGGESHFKVTITSKAFENLSLIKQHKMVNNLLAEELKGPIHALALKTIKP